MQKSFAGNIEQADIYFQQQQYKLALGEYITLADGGNARAFYQLGAIYYNGFGVDQSETKALVWFALAAEHDFENSVEIVNDLLSGVPATDKEKLLAIIAQFKKAYGKQGIQDKYFPQINEANLSEKIVYSNGKQLDAFYITTDEGFIEDDDSEVAFDDEIYDSEGFSETETFKKSSVLENFKNRPYMLVVDYDIAPDGSRRNFNPVQVIGNPNKGILDLSYSNSLKPTFKGKSVNFVHRSYLGVANYGSSEIRRELSFLYSRVTRYVRKLADSEIPEEQYQHAAALMYFTWLKREEGQVEALLKSSSNGGYIPAQFEYGLLLYREQKDIKLAVELISKAAQQGFTQAQYRLGRLILDSPWIMNDEKRALFWLELAAEEAHVGAALKASEVKLLSKNKQLLDVSGAIELLDKLTEEEAENPEYLYLQALAHNNMRPRKLSVAVTYIREAIELGDDRGWDISLWENTLKGWTSGGSVTIVEMATDD
ncbi:hypothetical protein RGQ13_16890 [Thalassotalea psychrophila]|uniref:Sel1 repeat family protein n=1 Tax=Thalassotalea psychrophila TaxID=3065647 RepID=A0ABY9TSR1_9GAMM|nr:hypothetical protein RGQ13_16890 [Colwelliaceae bacterium SQ149]